MILSDFAKDYFEHIDNVSRIIEKIKGEGYGKTKMDIQNSLNIKLADIYSDSYTNALAYVTKWDALKLGKYWEDSDGEVPTQVVAFKPTNVHWDWFYNFGSVRPSDITLGPTNRTRRYRAGWGFGHLYQALKDKGLNPRDICAGKPYTLVTGFSLGGAIANLAAIDLALWGCKVKHITGGTPRVFTTKSADAIQEELGSLGIVSSKRWVNSCDVIASVPMTLLDFKHIGQAYAISTTEDTCDANHVHQAYRKDQNYVGIWWSLRWSCHAIHFKANGYANAMNYTLDHRSKGCNAPPSIAPIEGCAEVLPGGPGRWWWKTDRTGQIKCIFPKPASGKCNSFTPKRKNGTQIVCDDSEPRDSDRHGQCKAWCTPVH